MHVEDDAFHATPYLHDLEVTSGDVTLQARYGISDRFGVEAIVPYRLSRSRITYRTLEGAPFTPDPPDVHHANRTLTGFGDPWLLFGAGVHADPWSFGARAGASLPLGSTEEDPFALGDLGLEHEHIQFGSGTVQPIGALGVGRAFGGTSVSAVGLARFGVATNEHGYRPGDQFLAQALVTDPLGVPHASFSLGPTLFHETAETWQGQVGTEGNLGRSDVYVEGRASWAPSGGRLAFGGTLRVPVWSESTGDQLDVPVSFRLSISTSMGGTAP